MSKWQMSCTCGDKMYVEADSKEEAVDKLLDEQMTPDAVAQHWADKHAGEPMPSPDQARAGLLASAVEV